MKIAEIAPLIESVPPRLYGGTERVVAYLIEELVKLGHEVTLFASGDSKTSAKLIPVSQSALRLNKNVNDYSPYNILMLERVYQHYSEFDLIHSHLDYLLFPVLRHLDVPSVTTLHGSLEVLDNMPIYKEFCDLPWISISNNQRQPFPKNNWLATIYHGMPENLYTYQEKPGQYLVFLGRSAPEKGIEEAITIAKKSGIKLKISTKIDKTEQEYFATKIKPLLNNSLIEFIGEINDRGKNELLSNALALLFPINWPEPFGLVMIEAMACGTPVIAYRHGSVPEIIQDNETGFICNNAKEAADAVLKISSLSRKRCRQIFEQRFTSRRMAEDYIKIFQMILKK